MDPEKTVLIVDDEVLMRRLAARSLAEHGYRVEQAPDGIQALEMTLARQPDLIIFDMLMPKMNGFEFCRKLVELKRAFSSRVLITSSSLNEKSRLMQDIYDMPLLKAGFLKKPFDEDGLIAHVREILGEAPPRVLPSFRREVIRPAGSSSASGVKAAPERPVPPRAAPTRSADIPQEQKFAHPRRDAEKTPPTPEPMRTFAMGGPQAAAQTPPSAPSEPDHAQPIQKTPDRADVVSQHESEPAKDAAQSRAGGKRRFRIMVIDDEPDITLLLQLALSQQHKVQTAENGMDALWLIDWFSPDFVICDMMMPGMDGLETVKAIRSKPDFAQIPVFFLTGVGARDVMKKAYEVGANLYLRKPMDMDRLLAIIDRFAEELDLEPRPEKAGGGPPPKGIFPTAPDAGATGSASRAQEDALARVLVIETDEPRMSRLRKALGEQSRGRWDTIWAEDVHGALANIKRWEPDIVVYDPRNAGLDGIAFVQMLKIKKLDDACRVAFIGKDFFPAERDFSERVLKSELLDLNDADSTLLHNMGRIVDSVRGRTRPKSQPAEQIEVEDRKARLELLKHKKQLESQNESFQKRFQQIQAFIDKELGH